MTQIKRINIVNAVIIHIFEVGLIYYLGHMAKFYMPPLHSFFDSITLAAHNIITYPFDCFYWNPAFALLGIGVYLILWCLFFLSYEKNKRRRANVEHGSAQWGSNPIKFSLKMSHHYNGRGGKRGLKDPQSIIMSKNLRLGLDGRKTMINQNVVITGSAGSGKSRGFVIPNILNANTSYVITDPKGELVRALGTYLENRGYVVKVFNLKDVKHSNCYNMWHYIQYDESLITAMKCFFNSTKPEGNGGDGFWTQAAEQLMIAIVAYLYETVPHDEVNFDKILKLITAAKVDENDSEAKSSLDLLFEKLQKENPKSTACFYYAEAKQAAGKTMQGVLMSLNTRFNAIGFPTVKALTYKDELELEKLGTRKTALFIVTPDYDGSLDCLVTMLYYQIFITLLSFADSQPSGRLPVPVQLVMDEFANLTEIPEFNRKMAASRSRLLSIIIVLQSLSQLKARYKDEYEGILANCNTKINLGTDDKTTLEFWTKQLLGNETIYEEAPASGIRSKNGTTGPRKMSRLLMTEDELSLMPNDTCLIAFKGFRPFKDKKYNVKKHPQYKKCGLYDSSLNFDVSSLIVDPIPDTSKFDEELETIIQSESLNSSKARNEFLQGIINDFATAEVEEPSELQAVDPDKLADNLNRTSPFDSFDDVPEEYRQLLSADSDEANSNIDDKDSEEAFDQFEDNNFFKNP